MGEGEVGGGLCWMGGVCLGVELAAAGVWAEVKLLGRRLQILLVAYSA